MLFVAFIRIQENLSLGGMQIETLHLTLNSNCCIFSSLSLPLPSSFNFHIFEHNTLFSALLISFHSSLMRLSASKQINGTNDFRKTIISDCFVFMKRTLGLLSYPGGSKCVPILLTRIV